MARQKALAFYLLVLVTALGIGLARPVAFQKSNAIVPAEEFETLSRQVDPLQIEPLLRSIPPHNPSSEGVWAVRPSDKYRETLVEGRGNCSHLAFGMAYLLDRKNVDYQVVHIMPRQGFLRGAGHTILRTRFEYQGRDHTGLVDVLGGGLPMRAERIADVTDLSSPISDFAFASLNAGRRSSGRYYGEFLEDTVVGVIPAREVRSYYAFLESVFIPLGHAKFEKHVFDGLALLLGKYPGIRVTDEAALFAGHEVERAMHRGALWTLRSSLVVIPGWLFIEASIPLMAVLQSAARRARLVRSQPQALPPIG